MSIDITIWLLAIQQHSLPNLVKVNFHRNSDAASHSIRHSRKLAAFCIELVEFQPKNRNEMVESNGAELTEHEAELYDRQIRLWGLDSQKR